MMQTASVDFAFPPELMTEILRLLSAEDQKAFSSSSQLLRKLALPFIFKSLRYTGKITPKIRNIHHARKDVKDAIEVLELHSRIPWLQDDDESTVIFEFLQSLTNLQNFEYRQTVHLVQPEELPKLINSVRHLPLQKFVLRSGNHATVKETSPVGLIGLKSLCIAWNNSDNPAQPGSSLDHLYALIRPSLPTLVDLTIDVDGELDEPRPDVDLLQLRAAAQTLRCFEYTLHSWDDTILDTIPKIFPHLTKLSITWDNTFNEHSLPWKRDYVHLLARNTEVRELSLSLDFEVDEGDPVQDEDDFPWFLRCYERRLRATEEIVVACPELRKCSWVQLGIDHINSSMVHSFVVHERSANGKPERVVRGVKQYWMGKDYEDVLGCTMESLPGEIIEEKEAASLWSS